jgi:hypothetical protein
MEQAKTFAEFLHRNGLKARPTGGIPCTTCSLPPKVRHDIEAERKGARDGPPASFQLLAAYLKKCHGVNISGAAIRRHFVEGHVK